MKIVLIKFCADIIPLKKNTSMRYVKRKQKAVNVIFSRRLLHSLTNSILDFIRWYLYMFYYYMAFLNDHIGCFIFNISIDNTFCLVKHHRKWLHDYSKCNVTFFDFRFSYSSQFIYQDTAYIWVVFTFWYN